MAIENYCRRNDGARPWTTPRFINAADDGVAILQGESFKGIIGVGQLLYNQCNCGDGQNPYLTQVPLQTKGTHHLLGMTIKLQELKLQQSQLLSHLHRAFKQIVAQFAALGIQSQSLAGQLEAPANGPGIGAAASHARAKIGIILIATPN